MYKCINMEMLHTKNNLLIYSNVKEEIKTAVDQYLEEKKTTKSYKTELELYSEEKIRNKKC